MLDLTGTKRNTTVPITHPPKKSAKALIQKMGAFCYLKFLHKKGIETMKKNLLKLDNLNK